MNKYPGFVPPGSGQVATAYTEYPFAKYTQHLGTYDNMDWNKKTNPLPQSYYHPYYLHHIHDSLLSLRDPATAASMELGIGTHIAEIARYANRNNLGFINQRVGVGYFKTIGISGGSTWWNDQNGLSSVVVNSGFAAENIDTQRVDIVSGYFSKESKFTVDITNTNLTITTQGWSYLDTIKDIADRWVFAYGNIKTLDDVSLFSGLFKIFNESSGVIRTSDEVLFKDNVSTRDLTLSLGILSGFFDTYARVGISDTNLITYSTTGHSHDASGWMLPTSDSSIVGNTIFDGRYYYALGTNQILEMDSLGTKENWTPRHSFGILFMPSARIFKDSREVRLVNNGRLPAKVGIVNPFSVYGRIGEDTLYVSGGRTYKITGGIENTDEFYYINDVLYFVHKPSNDKSIYIYSFNGRDWQRWSTPLVGQLINTWVSNSEIFIAHHLNNRLALTRFNLIGLFRPINSFPLFGRPSMVAVLDHDVVCLSREYTSQSYNVYVYQIQDSNRYQRILYNLPGGTLSIYHNSQNIFVQVGNIKRKILRNKSASLSLDSIGGLFDAKGEISVIGSLKTKSLLIAMCADSLYIEDNPIYKHMFLLEPGRSGDEAFEYTGDFKDTYINRYVFNQTTSDAHTYNDITCSTVYNNTYYFGHRGDISTFLKSGDVFKLVTPTALDGKIVVKFLPLDNSLYALVQDFSDAYIDFVYGLPSSPNASEYNNTNFIPYHPGPWSVPKTKLYVKDKNSNNWKEDTKYTERYGLNMIDAITHDNNIYLLAHDRSGSGIVSVKYAYDEPNPTGMLLSFSGVLNLNESFVGMGMDPEVLEFVPTTDGRFVQPLSGVWSGIYEYRGSADINGHHEFYLYNHPTGPYVVHDQVEVLYSSITPSSIYSVTPGSVGYPTQSYLMKNMGDRYSYRTLSVTFLKQELARPVRTVNPWDTTIPISPLDVNNPTIKIPITKDHPTILTVGVDANKFAMKSIAQDKDCNRRNIHFITSITHNKNVYLLVQVDQAMRIYGIRDFGDYIYKTPKMSSTNTYHASGVCTVFGDGLSYAGIKTNANFIPSGALGNTFFLDFVPCELSNTIVTEFSVSEVIGSNPGPVYILGDGDDLFIQKPQSTNYRHNKRFSTHATIALGSNIYLPITVRVNHPTGRLYTFVLGFFGDGSIGLVDNENVPIQLLNKPTGRCQCLLREGKYVIASVKMTDDAQEYISYADVKNNPIYGDVILDTIPHAVFNTLYNPFAKKKWLIGEYDIKINDNLNVREMF